MTQRDTVLQLLRQAGPQGVHTFELRGQFIGNPSQRIAELEALGHPISHTRERLHGQATGTRYRLVSGAASAVSLGGTHGHAPAGVAPESTLFDPAEGSRTLSPYDKEAA